MCATLVKFNRFFDARAMSPFMAVKIPPWYHNTNTVLDSSQTPP